MSHLSHAKLLGRIARIPTARRCLTSAARYPKSRILHKMISKARQSVFGHALLAVTGRGVGRGP